MGVNQARVEVLAPKIDIDGVSWYFNGLPNIADCIAGDEDKHPQGIKKSRVAVQVTGKELLCGDRDHTETWEEDIYKRHLGRAGATSAYGVYCR